MDVVAVTQSLSYLRPKRKPMYRPQGRKKVSTIRCFLLICKIPKSACRWGKFPHVIYFWSYFESMKAGIWKYESRYLRKGEIDYHTSVTLPKYSWVLCDLSKCSVCSSLTWMLQEVKVQLGESRIHHRGFCGTSQVVHTGFFVVFCWPWTTHLPAGPNIKHIAPNPSYLSVWWYD